MSLLSIVILSEDWSLRDEREGQPQSKDLCAACTAGAMSGISYEKLK